MKHKLSAAYLERQRLTRNRRKAEEGRWQRDRKQITFEGVREQVERHRMGRGRRRILQIMLGLRPMFPWWAPRNNKAETYPPSPAYERMKKATRVRR